MGEVMAKAEDAAMFGRAAGAGKSDMLRRELIEALGIENVVVWLLEVMEQRDEAMDQRDALLAALGEVEYVSDGWGHLVCGWCHKAYNKPHRDDCGRQSALATVKGD